MIHLVLDTTIYRKNPKLDSPEFKALASLAEKGHVKIHVPYMVENEFGSFLDIEQKKKANELLRSLKGLVNYNDIGANTKEIKKFKSFVEKEFDNLTTERRESFCIWLNKVRAQRYKITQEDSEKSFKAYFEGGLPFKEPKVRKDIPDAFIFQAILKLESMYGNQLHLVVEDEKLFEACGNLKANSHKALNEFINLSIIKEALGNSLIEEHIELISKISRKIVNENEPIIMDKIEDELSNDGYNFIDLGDRDEGIEEIYVSYFSAPHKFEIVSDIEDYGDGLFVFHFEIQVELTYERAVPHSETYGLDLEEHHVEYLNRHYSNVESTSNFGAAGRLEINYNFSYQEITGTKKLSGKSI